MYKRKLLSAPAAYTRVYYDTLTSPPHGNAFSGKRASNSRERDFLLERKSGWWKRASGNDFSIEASTRLPSLRRVLGIVR